MRTDLLWLVALSCLLTHEMDAIRLREWKIFPILSGMSDQHGYALFTAIHVPLYVLVLGGLLASSATLQQRVVIGLDLFCMVHVGLHLIFRNHQHNHFRSPFSWALILGAGIAGALDLLLVRQIAI